mgnify:CR=1 FL=1
MSIAYQCCVWHGRSSSEAGGILAIRMDGKENALNTCPSMSALWYHYKRVLSTIDNFHAWEELTALENKQMFLVNLCKLIIKHSPSNSTTAVGGTPNVILAEITDEFDAKIKSCVDEELDLVRRTGSAAYNRKKVPYPRVATEIKWLKHTAEIATALSLVLDRQADRRRISVTSDEHVDMDMSAIGPDFVVDPPAEHRAPGGSGNSVDLSHLQHEARQAFDRYTESDLDVQLFFSQRVDALTNASERLREFKRRVDLLDVEIQSTGICRFVYNAGVNQINLTLATEVRGFLLDGRDVEDDEWNLSLTSIILQSEEPMYKCFIQKYGSLVNELQKLHELTGITNVYRETEEFSVKDWKTRNSVLLNAIDAWFESEVTKNIDASVTSRGGYFNKVKMENPLKYVKSSRATPRMMWQFEEFGRLLILRADMWENTTADSNEMLRSDDILSRNEVLQRSAELEESGVLSGPEKVARPVLQGGSFQEVDSIKSVILNCAGELRQIGRGIEEVSCLINDEFPNVIGGILSGETLYEIFRTFRGEPGEELPVQDDVIYSSIDPLSTRFRRFLDKVNLSVPIADGMQLFRASQKIKNGIGELRELGGHQTDVISTFYHNAVIQQNPDIYEAKRFLKGTLHDLLILNELIDTQIHKLKLVRASGLSFSDRFQGASRDEGRSTRFQTFSTLCGSVNNVLVGFEKNRDSIETEIARVGSLYDLVGHYLSAYNVLGRKVDLLGMELDFEEAATSIQILKKIRKGMYTFDVDENGGESIPQHPVYY